MHKSESTTHERNEPPVDDTLINFQDPTVSTRP